MIKGLSLPYYALYNFDGSSIVYSGGGNVGKAVRYSTEFNIGEDNPFYADNGKAEIDKGKMIDGTITLETTHLSRELSKTMFGLKEKTVAVDAKSVTVNVYDDDAKSPYLGFGIIEWHQINNVDKYRAIVLLKVAFSIPSNAANTKGESVEWQTREISGTIERSDLATETEKYPWMYEAYCDTEAEALAFLRTVLNIHDARLKSLSIGDLVLTPAFSESIYTYAAETTSEMATITAAAKDTNATIEIKNGETTVTNGGTATWEEGVNTVTITVTNEDVTKTYTVTVTYTPEG